jgi:hypothetical protein
MSRRSFNKAAMLLAAATSREVESPAIREDQAQLKIKEEAPTHQ